MNNGRCETCRHYAAYNSLTGQCQLELPPWLYRSMKQTEQQVFSNQSCSFHQEIRDEHSQD